MPHDHAGHSHHHHHHPHQHGDSLARMRLAFWLNFCFAIFELLGGIWTNSVAIMSDAVHDFGDALAIGTALYLEKKSKTHSDKNYSYGYRRFSTAAALFTGIVLILGALWILVESIPRLLTPESTNVDGMIGFAVVGVLVNGFGFIKLSRGKSLSERAITWHLLEDLMGWVLVLIGAVVMKFFDLPIIDPVLGVMLSLWVLWNVGKTLREGLRIFLQATPHGIEISKIESFFQTFEAVQGSHHTHIWTMDGDSHILTTHLVVSSRLGAGEYQQLKTDVKSKLKTMFNILEATIEIETAADPCADPSHKES